jgi:hypothetical protein
MALKRCGFFRELEHGDDNGESLRELRETARYNENQRQAIVAYLEQGRVVIGCPGLVCDVLKDDASLVIGSPNILTDGEWMWPADFAYYVSEFDVPVPESMLQHMEHSNWMVADEVDVTALEL